MEKLSTISCGQPKQVIFSPDGKYIVLPLLDDNGFQIINIILSEIFSFSLTKKTETPELISPLNPELKGFAEGLFVPEKKHFLFLK